VRLHHVRVRGDQDFVAVACTYGFVHNGILLDSAIIQGAKAVNARSLGAQRLRVDDVCRLAVNKP
jgi:hypothetical protein